MILRKYRKPRPNPNEDVQYRAWIRTLPCVVCQQWQITRRQFGPVECAHVGPRALSRKCSDYETIPLCVWHHRLGPQSYHAMPKSFWTYWKINRAEILQGLNQKYREEKAA